MWKISFTAALLVAIPAVALSDDLTDHTVAALKSELPGSTITVEDIRTLKVQLKGDKEFSVSLDNIERACASDAAGCSHVVADFAHKVAATMTPSAFARTRENLRAVVRDERYAGNLNAMMKAAPTPTTVVAKPIAGRLVEICYFDSAEGMSPASNNDIAKLGLDRTQAFALCESNVHGVLPPLASAASYPGRGIGVLGGDAYASSYFLFHDDWKPIVAKLHGALLVSVPESAAVIFSEETGSEAASTLARAAANGMKTAEHPVSDEVLRWTESGWEATN